MLNFNLWLIRLYMNLINDKNTMCFSLYVLVASNKNGAFYKWEKIQVFSILFKTICINKNVYVCKLEPCNPTRPDGSGRVQNSRVGLKLFTVGSGWIFD